ncbi:MMPL family transporter [Actinocorallia sp. A-T 12471]|uniref:MMPL family transporter n=1 Tax=Actinocorallia sp. A-T 12471 TaxID=3089813 RepID=UPI0029D23103|nr:MMPL family transporter [Actinocorallia sp. A-T 12471]MDX6742269.1 MMPL family transporter [Actinocorallia sp. A-T 12471]
MEIAEKLGGWSARHRVLAVTLWVLFVVGSSVLGSLAGQRPMTDAEDAFGGSRQAIEMLEEAGIEDPASELVLVHGTDASAVVAAVEGTGQAVGVREAARSGDKVLVAFDWKGDPDEAAGRYPAVRDAIAATGAHTEVFGSATVDLWFERAFDEDFKRAEWTAVPLALGILLIAFGALVAAVLPVALALTAFVAALGLTALLSHQFHAADATNSVMLLMGLAVGVDYCLFYLRREREERALGMTSAEALRIAARTSGHSVLVSGATVSVAMAGLFLSGMPMFVSFAVGTIVVVLVAMTGSVTVLPALLSLLGDRVDAGRIVRRCGPRREARLMPAIVRGVLARPGLAAALSAVFLIVLALPVLGMKTELLSLRQTIPAGDPLLTAYTHIEEAFPGRAETGEIIVKGPAGDLAALGEAREQNGLTRITVPLADEADLQRAREAIEGRPDAALRGDLAFSADYTAQLNDALLPVFAFVAAAAFLIMLAAFRSAAIALTSVMLNLLSVAAAYGVITGIFQHRWGDELFGTTGAGAVQAWLPLFVFVILFGLSMDYHVFVVSRIQEAWRRGMPTREAIAHGIGSSAGTVTSAALIMVAVFAVFATLSMQDFKQLGVGLAVAVLLDATVIRAVLLPSILTLLGDRTWSLRKPKPVPAPQDAPLTPVP